jgi:hypothetical protein
MLRVLGFLDVFHVSIWRQPQKLSKGPPEIDDERGDKSRTAARDFDVRRARGIPTMAPLDAIAVRDNLPSSPARPAPSCQDWLAMGLQS